MCIIAEIEAEQTREELSITDDEELLKTKENNTETELNAVKKLQKENEKPSELDTGSQFERENEGQNVNLTNEPSVGQIERIIEKPHCQTEQKFVNGKRQRSEKQIGTSDQSKKRKKLLPQGWIRKKHRKFNRVKVYYETPYNRRFYWKQSAYKFLSEKGLNSDFVQYLNFSTIDSSEDEETGMKFYIFLEHS